MIKIMALVLLSAFLVETPMYAQESANKVVLLPAEIHQKTKCMNSKFLLFTPKGSAEKNKSPLIIFLHGMGERGNKISGVKRHGPPMIVEKQKDFPFMVVSPQCLKDMPGKPGRGRWNPEDIMVLLDYVKKTYHVDERRIYLTGLSMGGYGSWKVAASYPDAFVAIAPICGGGDPKNAAKYGQLPIWAFHGDQDKTVKIEASQKMVDAIKAVKGNVKFTIYHGVGHNSWTKTYANPELYQWFLSHQRK